MNASLATEYACVLRYYRHYFMASGMLAGAVKGEFLEHAQQEQKHAGMIAERIVQLGGEPDLNPDTLTARSHAEYKEGKDLRDMVKENLVAERIAIDSYRELINYIGDKDTTTKRILEQILATDGRDGQPEAIAVAPWTVARYEKQHTLAVTAMPANADHRIAVGDLSQQRCAMAAAETCSSASHQQAGRAANTRSYYRILKRTLAQSPLSASAVNVCSPSPSKARISAAPPRVSPIQRPSSSHCTSSEVPSARSDRWMP